MRYFLTGLPGSGKSHWGRVWAEKSNLMYFDLDNVIESNEGQVIKDIFNSEGESHFRNLETFYLNKLIDNYKAFIISCGGGTPCHNNNMELMNSKGTTIFLNPPLKDAAKRVWKPDGSNSRPLFSNCSTVNDVTKVLENLNAERINFYRQAHYELNSWDASAIKKLSK
jgi:shikimate kinase